MSTTSPANDGARSYGLALWFMHAACVASVLACDAAGREDRTPLQHPPVAVLLERDLAAAGIGPTEFVMAPSVAWVSDTSLAVVDVSDQQVVVYHPAGHEMARLGRKGGGPGEFRGAALVLGVASGGMVVADAALSRLSVFDARGQFVRSVPLSGFPQHLLWVDNDELTAVWTNPGPVGEGPVVGRVDLRTGAVREMFAVFAADSALAVPGPAPGGPSPFVAAAAVGDATIALGEPSVYRVVKVDTLGRPTSRFGRSDLEPEVPDRAEVSRREDRMREALRSVGRTPPPEVRQMLERAVRQPKPFFTVASFAGDQAGRLWIATTRGTRDSTEFDVFSPTGELVGTVSIPHRARALAIRGRRCAILVERRDRGHEGQHAVQVYDIVAGQPEVLRR